MEYLTGIYFRKLFSWNLTQYLYIRFIKTVIFVSNCLQLIHIFRFVLLILAGYTGCHRPQFCFNTKPSFCMFICYV